MSFLLLLACTEYGLKTHPVDTVADEDDTAEPIGVDTATQGDTSTPTETGEGTVEDTEPVEDTGPVEEGPPVDCTGVDFGTWQWWGSQPFTTEGGGPSDDGGHAFQDPSYSMVGWSTIAMPDRNVPVEQARAYLARFDLSEVPPDMTLTLASDDGLWLWVNGVEVGHYGGDWGEEGCVNEGGSCEELVSADPVDVTSLLVPGPNVIAARVYNAIVGSWFEVTPACEE